MGRKPHKVEIVGNEPEGAEDHLAWQLRKAMYENDMPYTVVAMKVGGFSAQKIKQFAEGEKKLTVLTVARLNAKCGFNILVDAAIKSEPVIV